MRVCFQLQIVGSAPPALLTGSVRALAGASLASMITSFFRKPLLVGASSSPAAPAVAAMSYPVTGGASARGETELQIAFAAAFSVAVR